MGLEHSCIPGQDDLERRVLLMIWERRVLVMIKKRRVLMMK